MTLPPILTESHPDADQVVIARGVLDAIETVDQTELVEFVRSETRWSAPLLSAVSKLEAGESPGDIVGVIDDIAWIDRLAEPLGRFTSVGLLSMGHGTTAVLSTADMLGRLPAQGFTGRLAVRQAFTHLAFGVVMEPPEAATALLLPAAASRGSLLAVAGDHAERAAQAHLNGAVVLPVVHPLAELSEEDEARYQLPDGFTWIGT